MKFCPFSHLPGTRALLPGTTLVCELFPALIRIGAFEQPIATPHPLEQFTVIQDLEKGVIRVKGGIEIYPGHNNSFGIRGTGKQAVPLIFRPRERLHLGMHKKEEWPHMALRADLKEILPIWFYLAQSIPSIPADPRIFEAETLFTRLLEPDHAAYLALFKAAFSHLFVPRTKDVDYHGFSLPVVSDESIHPLLILQESYPLIRKLFFKEEENRLFFLPKLFREFHSGTLTNLKTRKGHTLFIEWTKHTIRRIGIEPACDDEYSISLQKEIKQFRVRTNKKERGTRYQNHASLLFHKGKKYLLDAFTS